jgi:hypothetical protein
MSATMSAVRRSRFLVLSMACCVGVVGCTAGHEPRGTVVGKLHEVGGQINFSTGPPTGMRGTVKAEALVGGKSYEVAVPDSGQFQLRLPPGQYKLTGTSPLYNGGDAFDCFFNAVDPLMIRDSVTTTADVICPIG